MPSQLFTRAVSRLSVAVACTALVGLAGSSGEFTANNTGYLIGHDNTTAAVHQTRWTHGDPNAGTFGSPLGSNGYYYLNVVMAGDYAWCEVYTEGDWRIQIMSVTGTSLVKAEFRRSNGWGGGRVFYHGHAGQAVRCRIANIGPLKSAQKDYAEFNSGNPGDLNSDCGGPGPVVDPNTGAPPFEPSSLSTVGPAIPNACQVPTTQRGLAAPVNSWATDFGSQVPSGVYSVTIPTRCDLTAIAFYGGMNKPATITITDAGGQVVNGLKWGAAISNPNPPSMNQEFVAADAGVQPAGTYLISYSGMVAHLDVIAVAYPQAVIARPMSPR